MKILFKKKQMQKFVKNTLHSNLEFRFIEEKIFKKIKEMRKIYDNFFLKSELI